MPEEKPNTSSEQSPREVKVTFAAEPREIPSIGDAKPIPDGLTQKQEAPAPAEDSKPTEIVNETRNFSASSSKESKPQE